jgi:hypothetical protein
MSDDNYSNISQRLPWARIGWFDAAADWIQDQLLALGYEITAPIEQLFVRIWSTVLRVPTTAGDIYFKAAAPAFAYEPALTQVLCELLPANMPRVLAIDRERAWMLIEDAGETLRDIMPDEGDVYRLQDMLVQFARVQQASIAYVSQLLAAGCPDRRLELLPDLYEELLADTPALLLGEEQGVTAAEYAKLRELTPEVKQLCASLASFGIPAALHHDDFHPGNVMIRDNRTTFFDWAESGVTHPFCSILIALRYSKLVYGLDDDALHSLTESYLHTWTDFASIERLRESLPLAMRVGILCRALTWHHAVAALEDSTKWEYVGAMPHYLRLFLLNDPWG